jgi:hypothetical protein
MLFGWIDFGFMAAYAISMPLWGKMVDASGEGYWINHREALISD